MIVTESQLVRPLEYSFYSIIYYTIPKVTFIFTFNFCIFTIYLLTHVSNFFLLKYNIRKKHLKKNRKINVISQFFPVKGTCCSGPLFDKRQQRKAIIIIIQRKILIL